MRLLIDATPLLFRSAGVKNYIYHWLRALERAAPPETVRTFPVAAEFGELNHEGSQWSAWRTFAGLARLHLLNRSGLDWRVPGIDVFHASTLMLRPPRNARLTTTVHDMTCWLMPELHSPANVRAIRRFGDEVMRRADRLIAVSENTRNDAARILGLDELKIAVIHSGVADAFFDAGAPAAEAARLRHGLEKPYVLFVGTIEPRKNVDRLLSAYGALRPDLRDAFELVVAGPAGWGEQATIARLKATSGVRYLGYVPEGDLPGLTAGAAVFVYPSLYEGFGFPVAQAMAAGAPVITSAVSSLPEVAAGSGLLVDPRSEHEIRAALERLLESPGLRGELRAKGRDAAARYRWDVCARRSLEFFESVAGGAQTL
jgi:glycosyltransferase involved in cell wall biosynthesis